MIFAFDEFLNLAGLSVSMFYDSRLGVWRCQLIDVFKPKVDSDFSRDYATGLGDTPNAALRMLIKLISGARLIVVQDRREREIMVPLLTEPTGDLANG